jgi:hypothetical protein
MPILGSTPKRSAVTGMQSSIPSKRHLRRTASRAVQRKYLSTIAPARRSPNDRMAFVPRPATCHYRQLRSAHLRPSRVGRGCTIDEAEIRYSGRARRQALGLRLDADVITADAAWASLAGGPRVTVMLRVD